MSWTAHQLTAGPTLPPGQRMKYAVLMPWNYTPAMTCKLLVDLHENDSGDQAYQGGSVLNVAGSEADGYYNNQGFQGTWNDVIILVPAADQTGDTSGETENFGGWTGADGNNEKSVCLCVRDFIANNPTVKVDMGAIFATGRSLGGIGTWALAIDANTQTGTIDKLFAAFLPMAGVIERFGFGVNPTAAFMDGMKSIPIFAVHGAGDTTSQPNWDRAFWDHFSGGQARPGNPGKQAGSSAFWYLEDPGLGHDVWDTYTPTGAGKSIFQWLFSQNAAGAASPSTPNPTPTPSSPSPSGSMLTPGSGGTLTDGAGHVWSLPASGVVTEDGAPLDGGGGTGALTVINGTMYAQDASSKSWYTWSGNQFVAANLPSQSTPVPVPTPVPTPPPTPVPTPAPSNPTAQQMQAQVQALIDKLEADIATLQTLMTQLGALHNG